MLTTEQTEKLRAALLTDQARLIKSAQEGLQFSMNRDRDQVGRDSIDESMEEEMFSTELRLRDRESGLLGKIHSALERLDAGKIHKCEDCDEDIGFKRLLARPVTTLCIGCKEEREREERSEALVVRGSAGEAMSDGDEPVTVGDE